MIYTHYSVSMIHGHYAYIKLRHTHIKIPKIFNFGSRFRRFRSADPKFGISNVRSIQIVVEIATILLKLLNELNVYLISSCTVYSSRSVIVEQTPYIPIRLRSMHDISQT